jgi:hypothetical protein
VFAETPRRATLIVILSPALPTAPVLSKHVAVLLRECFCGGSSAYRVVSEVDL